MNYTNLADSPHLAAKALELIEKSFGYGTKDSFAVDFYPLFNSHNYKNCYLIEEAGEVMAHIGVKERELNSFPIIMLGGIAVAEKARGKGLFRDLFNYIIEANSQSSIYLLWSDKLDLYSKFGFYPAGKLFEYPQHTSQVEFSVELTTWDKFCYEDLYHNPQELRIKRTESDWNEVKKITSAELYLIKEKDKVINYFVKGKGADLTNIIHEYGLINSKHLKCMQNFGTVWSPLDFGTGSALYGTVIKPGSEKLFKDLIKSLFKLEVISFNSDQVTFIFDSKTLTLSQADFLTGTFGPNQYSELNFAKPLFISGLDSV